MDVVPNSSIIEKSKPRFLNVDSIPLKKLPGFGKNHSVPTFNSPAASVFLGKLVEKELRTEFQSIHDLMRKSFGLRRKEIHVTIEEHGAAILETELLRVQKEYLPDRTAPEFVKCEICIDLISDLNLLANPVFESDFPFRFERIEIAPDLSFDVEGIIDRLEELSESESGFTLNYNFEATECRIKLENCASELVVESKQLNLVSPQPKSGPNLIHEFAEYQRATLQLLEQ